MQGFDLREKDYVIIDGRPCRLITVSFYEDDNGDAFVGLVGLDPFTNKKLECQSLSTSDFDVPEVVRQDLQLINIDDGYLSMVGSEGFIKDNIKIPDGDLGRSIVDRFDSGRDLLLTVLSTMGMQAVVNAREV